MIKKRTLEIPAKEAQTKEISVYQCDCCDRESERSDNFCKCSLCGRLICRGTYKSCRHSDPHDPSDYPDNFCPICYKLKFETNWHLFQQADNDYYNTLDTLNEKIKLESLAQPLHKKEEE